MSFKNIIILVSLLIQSFAYAEVAEVRWIEADNKSVSVSMEDLKQSKAPLLGYVFDLRQKKGLCYAGKDYEVIDILYKGFNRHGTETCQSNIFVIGQTISVGPCWMPKIHDEYYTAEIPVCQ